MTEDMRGYDAAEWFIDKIAETVTDQLFSAPNVQALPDSIRGSVHNLLHGAATGAAGHAVRLLIEYEALSVSALHTQMLRARGL